MAPEPLLIHIPWYPKSDINQSADPYSPMLLNALPHSSVFCLKSHSLSDHFFCSMFCLSPSSLIYLHHHQWSFGSLALCPSLYYSVMPFKDRCTGYCSSSLWMCFVLMCMVVFFFSHQKCLHAPFSWRLSSFPVSFIYLFVPLAFHVHLLHYRISNGNNQGTSLFVYVYAFWYKVYWGG